MPPYVSADIFTWAGQIPFLWHFLEYFSTNIFWAKISKNEKSMFYNREVSFTCVHLKFEKIDIQVTGTTISWSTIYYMFHTNGQQFVNTTSPEKLKNINTDGPI